jgi:hypothetical protein
VQAANVVTLVAGAIVEAVSALFFVQTNRARVLMVDFFDRLRTDRKLREALSLAVEVGDPRLQSRLQTLLALTLAEVGFDQHLFDSILWGDPDPRLGADRQQSASRAPGGADWP